MPVRTKPPSVHEKAQDLGFLYIRGNERPTNEGQAWLTRFTKESDNGDQKRG